MQQRRKERNVDSKFDARREEDTSLDRRGEAISGIITWEKNKITENDLQSLTHGY